MAKHGPGRAAGRLSQLVRKGPLQPSPDPRHLVLPHLEASVGYDVSNRKPSQRVVDGVPPAKVALGRAKARVMHPTGRPIPHSSRLGSYLQLGPAVGGHVRANHSRVKHWGWDFLSPQGTPRIGKPLFLSPFLHHLLDFLYITVDNAITRPTTPTRTSSGVVFFSL